MSVRVNTEAELFWGRRNKSYNSGDKRESADKDQGDPRVSAPAPIARTKSVLGDDSRVPVADATEPPFSQIGLIYGYDDAQGRAKLSGTGWLISPDTLVTAGHNLFNKDAYKRSNGYQPALVKVWLGHNGEDHPPFDVRYAKQFTVHKSYLRDRRRFEFDVGVVKLDRPVENRHGFMKVMKSFDGLGDQAIGVVGYPSDIQSPPTKMFYAYGAAVSIDGNRLYHDVDSAKGQSGGPILTSIGDGARVVGIHTQGKEAAKAQKLTANMGVLLDQPILSWIKTHI